MKVDSCSIPVNVGSTVFGEIPSNDVVSASISNSSIVGVSGVIEDLN